MNYNKKLSTRNGIYGRSAFTIYSECCEKFGFNRELEHYFSIRTSLFSLNATTEGYCVWFICHSNLTRTKRRGIQNTISGDYITMKWEEFINVINIDNIWINQIRVVFHKDRLGNYYFTGVFKCVELDFNQRFAKFIKISDEYPMN